MKPKLHIAKFADTLFATKLFPNKLFGYYALMCSFFMLPLHLMGDEVVDGEKSILTESHSKPVILLLLGPPRSGRDLVSVKVSNTFSLPYVSCADLLLDYSDDETDLGKKIRECLHAGALISDALLLELISERLKEGLDCKNGFLLDGFPRTSEQARALKERFQSVYKMLPIYIASSDDWIVHFHKARLVCTNCGRVYHLNKAPPKNPEYCDFCHEKLQQRNDDSPETLKKRTEKYRFAISDLVSFYEKEGMLIQIDGTKSVDEMLQSIKVILNQK